MKQQTAVEFLQQALSIHLSFGLQMQFEGLFQQAKEMENQQTEISDEEIEKAAKFYKWKINQKFFEEGAKWYREQLKSKGNGNK